LECLVVWILAIFIDFFIFLIFNVSFNNFFFFLLSLHFADGCESVFIIDALKRIEILLEYNSILWLEKSIALFMDLWRLNDSNHKFQQIFSRVPGLLDELCHVAIIAVVATACWFLRISLLKIKFLQNFGFPIFRAIIFNFVIFVFFIYVFNFSLNRSIGNFLNRLFFFIFHFWRWNLLHNFRLFLDGFKKTLLIFKIIQHFLLINRHLSVLLILFNFRIHVWKFWQLVLESIWCRFVWILHRVHYHRTLRNFKEHLRWCKVALLHSLLRSLYLRQVAGSYKNWVLRSKVGLHWALWHNGLHWLGHEWVILNWWYLKILLELLRHKLRLELFVRIILLRINLVNLGIVKLGIHFCDRFLNVCLY
jgi:hypothetical protein